MPAALLRLALAQSSSARGDVLANVRAAAATVRDAAGRGAHLVVFPELFLTGYELALLSKTPDAWLVGNDRRLDPVREACADRGVVAVLGAAFRAPEGQRLISAPVIGPSGDLGVSHKEHLHGSETSLFQSGRPLSPFEVNGWRVAIGICFDAAHPRHAEHAALQGAELYLCSALYIRGEERRSDLHFGARAMDNRIFSALANHAGVTGGQVSCGRSGVWGPSGEVLTREDSAEARLLVVDLDSAELRRYRPE